jgi:hypothetical protein
MTYGCADFIDSVVDALQVTIPPESAESPSDQADLVLAEIQRLQRAARTVAMGNRYQGPIYLRDYFAGLALQGLYAGGISGWSHDQTAQDAYTVADAMMRERVKPTDLSSSAETDMARG